MLILYFDLNPCCLSRGRLLDEDLVLFEVFEGN